VRQSPIGAASPGNIPGGCLICKRRVREGGELFLASAGGKRGETTKKKKVVQRGLCGYNPQRLKAYVVPKTGKNEKSTRGAKTCECKGASEKGRETNTTLNKEKQTHKTHWKEKRTQTVATQQIKTAIKQKTQMEGT